MGNNDYSTLFTSSFWLEFRNLQSRNSYQNGFRPTLLNGVLRDIGGLILNVSNIPQKINAVFLVSQRTNVVITARVLSFMKPIRGTKANKLATIS